MDDVFSPSGSPLPCSSLSLSWGLNLNTENMFIHMCVRVFMPVCTRVYVHVGSGANISACLVPSLSWNSLIQLS